MQAYLGYKKIELHKQDGIDKLGLQSKWLNSWVIAQKDRPKWQLREVYLRFYRGDSVCS